MSETELKLAKAPIVEAVLDIDCHMPTAFDITAAEEKVRNAFRDQYPKFRNRFLEEHRIESKVDGPVKHTAKRAIQALQCLHEDERQLVQIRANGFSFNRLTPYSSFDDYVPEIQRTWELFEAITAPVNIQVFRLRYINRILLDLISGRVNLDAYFKVGPRLPDEEKLRLAGFVNQHSALELDTGYQVNIVLASQLPEKDKLPVIFDICVTSTKASEPKDWPRILAELQSLRKLKNRIFRESLTEKCLSLFQQ